MVFVCIFAPTSSDIKVCRYIPLDEKFPKDLLDKTFPCDEWPSKVKEHLGFRKEACDMSDLLTSKEKEKIAKQIESIAKLGPFKRWISNPASSIWIQLVSVTGIFVTGILLISYVFNFVAKFSKTPWNLFEMAFCAAMSFFYFTCGLDLFLKGSTYISQVL